MRNVIRTKRASLERLERRQLLAADVFLPACVAEISSSGASAAVVIDDSSRLESLIAGAAANQSVVIGPAVPLGFRTVFSTTDEQLFSGDGSNLGSPPASGDSGGSDDLAPPADGDPPVWRAEGPFSATDGQSENASPNDRISGAAHTVIAHPTNADILYIGGTNGGVWRTDNGTATNPNWTPLTDDLPSQSIGALAFDTADATFETIYAGTGQNSSFSRIGNGRVGLYKSTDGGANWQILNDRLAGANISGIAANGNNVVVSVNVADNNTFSNIGIFRSTDAGATFTRMSQGDGDNTGLPAGSSYDLVVDPIDPDVLYTSTTFSDNAGIGGQNGVYRSADGGASWTKVSSPAMDALILSSQTSNLELATGRSGEVYAAIINTGNLAGLFRSPDGGATWVQMDTPSTNENGTDVGLNPRGSKGPDPKDNPTQAELAGGQGSIHFSILADPNDSTIVYVGGDRQPRANGDQGGFPNSIGARDFSGRLFRGDSDLPAGSQFVHLTHSNTLARPVEAPPAHRRRTLIRGK